MNLNVQPRIRTILLLINIVMLIIMLGGINLLRVFENSLLRQTEIELNTQAVFVAALYKEFYARSLGQSVADPIREQESEVKWQPLVSGLDMASAQILPEQPPALKFDGLVSEREQQLGLSLLRILQEAQKQTLASIRIVNRDAVVISSTNHITSNQHSQRVALSNRAEVMAALAGTRQVVLRQRHLTHAEPSVFSISRSADIRVHVAHPVLFENKVIAAVILSRTPQGLSQLIGRHKLEISAYVICVLLLVWLMASLTSFTIRRPIDALVQQAERAIHGEKGAVTPLAYAGSHEVMQLSQAVSAMAQTLEQRADYIMEFVSHVSHEFKTPVTAIQGAVELLIDHSDTMTEVRRKRFLSNLDKDSRRIENLVYRLLDLARADLKKPNDETLPVESTIVQLINTYREGAADVIYTQKEVEDSALAALSIRFEVAAFNSVLGNLIDNAVQAGADTITLSAESEAGNLLLQVTDNGAAIAAGNVEKLFEPFFTTRRDSGGTGLGLAIIRAQLRAYGGDITYRDKTFTVRIPC